MKTFNFEIELETSSLSFDVQALNLHSAHFALLSELEHRGLLFDDTISISTSEIIS